MVVYAKVDAEQGRLSLFSPSSFFPALFLFWFFDFNEFIRCGGTSGFKYNRVLPRLSFPHFDHINVTDIDNPTQAAHLVEKGSNVVVGTSDFHLERDLRIEIPAHLTLRLEEEEFQTGLGAEIGDAGQ